MRIEFFEFYSHAISTLQRSGFTARSMDLATGLVSERLHTAKLALNSQEM
jgi:hypothetical protein